MTEISLERTGCYGYCPEYTVSFRSDGRASYLGRGNVKEVGSYVATIPPETFEFLARVALELGVFDRLPEEVRCPVTDSATAFLVFSRGDERRVISHYAPGESGPATLNLFEQAIDIVSDQLEWKRVD